MGNGNGFCESDMKERANILVTEVFDTELIGEAAIATFNHAHRHLLTRDCIVVPCEAIIYAQAVSSNLVARWDGLYSVVVSGDGETINPPESLKTHSPLALHDLQLSQVKEEWFTPLTPPVAVFKFDFNSINGKPIPERQQTVESSIVLNSGKIDAIFMWWDIRMDHEKVRTINY